MFCLYVAIDNSWLVEETLKKLAILVSLAAALGVAQAAPTASIGVSVAADDITYIPFTWNGDNDGFDIFTSGSTSLVTSDPELFILNASGTSVLATDDDSGSGLNASITNIDLAAGSYWAAIGQFNTSSAEALAGFNPSSGSDPNPAFTTTLNFSANDQTGGSFGNFTNVGPTTTTPPSSNGNRVPEPGSLVLAGLGLGIAALVGRRRKQA